MVELIVNGKTLDLLEKGNEIKYTKQIADVLDIASISSSYTNSFQLPKTPHNTQVLEQLGISGDTSSIPYVKNVTQLKKQGFDLVRDGMLNISETSENYKTSVVDGIVELFKSMDNKTVGVDLDLSNFNHQKNIVTVSESFDNQFYRYIIADYGGLTMVDSAINIDYLTPSFSVVELLKLVFDTFGYSVNFEGVQEFVDGLWITYPLPPQINSEETVQSAILRRGTSVIPYTQSGSIWIASPGAMPWDLSLSTITEGSINQWRYFVPQSSPYTLNIKVKAYALYKGDNLSFSQFLPLTVSVRVDNIPVIEFQSDPYEIVERELNIFIESGSTIEIIYSVSQFVYYPNAITSYSLRDFHFSSIELNVKRISQGNVSLSNAMKSFKITDFLKEIIWRTATVPYFDEDKMVHFLTIEDRLNRANAIDLSDKFVRRTNEKYLRSSYAQKNGLRMKYNNEGIDSADGFITVNNQNIEPEKTIAQSQLYAPETDATEFTDVNGLNSFNASVLKMWVKEPEQTETGINIKYKALDNRYYFLRHTQQNGNFRLTSLEVPGSVNVPFVLVSNVANTTMQQTVPVRYAEYEKMFDNYRAHDIELALGLSDYLNFDLKRIYYFNQESKYYIINKITFQEGELSKAECVAVVPYIKKIINITSILPQFPLGKIAVYFNYSGFETENLTLQYRTLGFGWLSINIDSSSPESVTLPSSFGTYEIRIIYQEAISNTATITF